MLKPVSIFLNLSTIKHFPPVHKSLYFLSSKKSLGYNRQKSHQITMALSTIKSEGSLISADLLMKIHTGEATGQRTVDFGLDGKTRLIDEIAACWSDAKAYWDAFQHALKRVKEDESGATITREQWVLPLLRSLGFDNITFARQAADVGGRTYAISHRLGDDEKGLPIHIEGAHFEIDKRPPTGRPRISPSCTSSGISKPHRPPLGNRDQWIPSEGSKGFIPHESPYLS